MRIQENTWAMGGGDIVKDGGQERQIHRRLAQFLEGIHHHLTRGGDAEVKEQGGGGEAGGQTRDEFLAEVVHLQLMMKKWLRNALDLGLPDMITPILEAGACSLLDSVIDADGHTLLHYAILTKRMRTSKLLVNYGADTNIEDNHGYTPAELAIKVGAHTYHAGH
jgi:hypothetical protein